MLGTSKFPVEYAGIAQAWCAAMAVRISLGIDFPGEPNSVVKAEVPSSVLEMLGSGLRRKGPQRTSFSRESSCFFYC